MTQLGVLISKREHLRRQRTLSCTVDLEAFILALACIYVRHVTIMNFKLQTEGDTDMI